MGVLIMITLLLRVYPGAPNFCKLPHGAWQPFSKDPIEPLSHPLIRSFDHGSSRVEKGTF